MSRIKDEMFTCPVCNYDIKKYKLKQHEHYNREARTNRTDTTEDICLIICHNAPIMIL